MAADVVAIEMELERIRSRIECAPRLETSALYSAQQALAWVLAPDRITSPFALITGDGSDSQAGSEGYSVHNHLPQS